VFTATLRVRYRCAFEQSWGHRPEPTSPPPERSISLQPKKIFHNSAATPKTLSKAMPEARLVAPSLRAASGAVVSFQGLHRHLRTPVPIFTILTLSQDAVRGRAVKNVRFRSVVSGRWRRDTHV